MLFRSSASRAVFVFHMDIKFKMGSNYYHKRHLYTDEQLISCYLKYESQQKAADELGVSRETVARAVRRACIPLTGRKNNGGPGCGSPCKITDEELIEESKTLNGVQIAKKYNIDVGRVYRRAKRLGLYVQVDGNKWKHRAARYGCTKFDDSITLEAVRQRDRDICQICGNPIDIKDIKNGHIRRLYPTVDHIIPLSKGGSHTWDNVQLAHMCCNAGKRDIIRR